jgi:tRNA(Ile)-lysidine synthase
MNVIVALSGGPDSIYLAKKLIDEGHNIVCAHINYNARECSKVDMAVANEFCEEYNVPIEILENTTKFDGNFQSEARKLRYKWFNELIKKHQFDCVAVGHHLDDHIETYLLQTKRDIVTTYGLDEFTEIEGSKI